MKGFLIAVLCLVMTVPALAGWLCILTGSIGCVVAIRG